MRTEAQVALYQKIVNNILQRLAGGEFLAGDRMYSIDEIKKMYNVSSTTAVKAVDELKKEGVIESIKGKGSFFCGLPTIDVSESCQELEGIALLSHGLNFFRNSFQLAICKGIEQGAADAGLGFRLQYIPEEEMVGNGKLPFTPDATEGLIMIDIQINPAILFLIQHPGLKTVLVDNVIPGTASTVPDNYYGMKQLIDHLYTLGHRNLLLAASHPHSLNHFNENERINAFNFIVDDRKLSGEVVGADEYDKIFSRLKKKKAPTAVLFTQDDPALAFIQKAEEKGIRIPDDISVTGFDNFASRSEGLEKLTTYAVDRKSLGEAAVKLLLSLNNSSCSLQPWRPVPGELAVRETTGAVRR